MITQHLREIPPRTGIPELVSAFRTVSSNPREIVSSLGWTWEFSPMTHGPSAIRSLLMPRGAGGFHIVVDARRRPGSPEVDWLLWHELAHSLFFTSGTPPARRFPWNPSEETFCDHFAYWAQGGTYGLSIAG